MEFDTRKVVAVFMAVSPILALAAAACAMNSEKTSYEGLNEFLMWNQLWFIIVLASFIAAIMGIIMLCNYTKEDKKGNGEDGN